jgi:amino-acid N-acetyltransferase
MYNETRGLVNITVGGQQGMNIDPIELNDEVVALLISEELPVSDLRSSNQPKLFGVRVGGSIIGIVGIESHGNAGLLRSLVVGKASRKAGCGQKLVAKAEAWANDKGVKSLYLLTTTAARYFSRLGYEVVPRNQAPASIVNTAQFTELCPASATFMRKILTANKALHRTSR